MATFTAVTVTLCDGAETAAKSSDEGSTFSDGTPPPSGPLSPPHDANSRHSAEINSNLFIGKFFKISNTVYN